MDQQEAIWKLIDTCRDAACLAHSVPGVSLRLRDAVSHRDLLVSSTCLAAPLDPCRFRGLVLAGLAGRLAALCQFASVEIAGGLVHLGAGIHQPSHPGESDDRWFVTPVASPTVVDVLAELPVELADDHAFNVLVKPDPELGRTAVRVRCDQRGEAHHLDEVALAAVSACLVEELHPTASPTPRRHP